MNEGRNISPILIKEKNRDAKATDEMQCSSLLDAFSCSKS